MERSEKEKSRYLEGIDAIILLTVAIYVIVIILKDPVAEPEIIMENEQANIEYLIQFGLNADTIKIYDTRYGLYDFCFDFSKEELSYALKELVENYEAYKVEP